MTKRIALIGMLLVIALSTVGSANASVPYGGDKSPALAPGDTISPSGTITSNVPQYNWESVSGATKYQIKLKKGFFKTVDDFKVSPGCVPTCWYYRAGILSNKDYKWKVRAKVGGNWQSWSAWSLFTVNDTSGFKSSFNNNANGWTEWSGNWKVRRGKYVVKGPQAKYATASHSGNYANFTYEVKFRRKWDGVCDSDTYVNSILTRGTPAPLASNKSWYHNTGFAYYDDGRYRVDEYDGGVWDLLYGPTASPAVNGGGWNTLLVVAKGTTYWLYINDVYIRATTDSSHTSGFVGVGYFQKNGCSDKYKVDWAKLSENTPW